MSATSTVMQKRWRVPMLLFAVVLGVTAFGLSLPAFDRLGSYVMVIAAVALAALVVLRWKTHKR